MDTSNEFSAATDPRLLQSTTWRKLAPSLTLSPQLNLAANDHPAFSEPAKAGFYDNICREGYATTDIVIDVESRNRMVRGIDEILSRNFSAIWALMYDEFWDMYARFAPIARYILGEHYLHVTGNYAFVIDNSDQAAGWGAHRDLPHANSLRPDGSPEIMSFWVALTDATPLNSCLYCVPASRDPNYPDNLRSLEIPKVEDIECMPVRAGQAVGLNHSLLHWGSRSSRRGQDRRISVVFDLQRGDCDAYHYSLIDIRKPLSFEQRAAYVAHNVLWLSKYNVSFSHANLRLARSIVRQFGDSISLKKSFYDEYV
jgi:ectoine hydroxylase-related dioxygenase (phytanoyl-CoA dioxygenase family)